MQKRQLRNYVGVGKMLKVMENEYRVSPVTPAL
jgi:hypothetical protein